MTLPASPSIQATGSACAQVQDRLSFDTGPVPAPSVEATARIMGPSAVTVEHGERSGRVPRDGAVVALDACAATARRRAEPQVRGGLPNFKRRRIIEFIEANLADDIRLADLAAMADMSERHFCTSFKRSVGLPPYRYVVGRRLLLASRLLTEAPGVTVTAIALQCGFKSSAHFATAFRKRFAMPPTRLRARA